MAHIERNQSERLIIRNGCWIIVFFDNRINKESEIELLTKDGLEAGNLFKKWLDYGIHQKLIYSWPLMGISVHCAASDYIEAPDLRHGQKLSEFHEMARCIRFYFGNAAIQELNTRECRSYAEYRRYDLVYENITDESLMQVFLQIRKELIFLRRAALYARRWQRILEAEMPDIRLSAVFRGLTYKDLRHPFPLEKTKRPRGAGAWAAVQRTMSRRWLLSQGRDSS